jgi:hypothetical protein
MNEKRGGGVAGEGVPGRMVKVRGETEANDEIEAREELNGESETRLRAKQSKANASEAKQGETASDAKRDENASEAKQVGRDKGKGKV